MAQAKPGTNARFARMFQPVLDSIKSLGGSARPAEVKEQIIKQGKLAADYLGETHPKSKESKFGNDVDWARFYLVRSGHLDSSKRGVWSVTEKGRAAAIDNAEAAKIIRGVDAGAAAAAVPANPEAPPPKGESDSYIELTLARLKALPPSGFENFCQRLLRESGFEEVNVTGKSGDGGIDGEGILKLSAFVSFRVLFQCKRHKDSVGPSVVRDFRGAMAGRAEKGIILTTGYFTPQAEEEASRDGADPIELADGEALVRLMAEFELGLKPVQSFEMDDKFFEAFA